MSSSSGVDAAAGPDAPSAAPTEPAAPAVLPAQPVVEEESMDWYDLWGGRAEVQVGDAIKGRRVGFSIIEVSQETDEFKKVSHDFDQGKASNDPFEVGRLFRVCNPNSNMMHEVSEAVG